MAKPTGRSVFYVSKSVTVSLLSRAELDQERNMQSRVAWTFDRRRVWDSIVQHRKLILVFLLLNSLDSLTTIIGLILGYSERNPLHAALISDSWWLSCLIKYMGVGLSIAASAVMFPSSMFIIKAMAAIGALVVITNLLVIV